MTRHEGKLAGPSALLVMLMATPVLAESQPIEATPDLEITDAAVTHDERLNLFIFEQEVAGEAGGTKPEVPEHARDSDDLHWEDVAAAGNFDGSAVLAYVFPTDLPPESVGFEAVEGTLALVASSHPAFDDTPLWDESGDGNYSNDGGIYHAHWVVLIEDERAPAGLAVREIEEDPAEKLPPTAPGMPIYLDSPGFQVQESGSKLRLIVPGDRIRAMPAFNFDAVTAYLEVNTSDEDRPTLGVYKVYKILSGDLSLPYEVTQD